LLGLILILAATLLAAGLPQQAASAQEDVPQMPTPETSPLHLAYDGVLGIPRLPTGAAAQDVPRITMAPLPSTPPAAQAGAQSPLETPAPVPPTATPAPTPTATLPSAQAILQAAFDASRRASSYRFDMDMLAKLSGPSFKEGAQIPMRFTGDFQSPDRTQGAMTVTVNGVDTETQVIVIGDASWVKDPLTDRWQVNPQATTLFNPKDLVMNASDVEELQFLG
jgi:hypothetical protein